MMMKIARANYTLYCSLVLERMEFADGVGLGEKLDRVWNDDARLDYYVHSGSLLSMMMGFRQQIQRHADHIKYSGDIYSLLCIADAANLDPDGQFCQGMFYGGHTIKEEHGGKRFMVYLVNVDSLAVIDAMMEYLVSDEYAECRQHVTELVVRSDAWIDVLQYVFDTPACLPGLLEISLISHGTGMWKRTIPVRTPLLHLWVTADDVQDLRETVAKAVGLTHLWVHTNGTFVCEFENETVHSAVIFLGDFAGRFPNLRRVTFHNVSDINLTGCPRIELVFMDNMGKYAYAQILRTAPRLPTRPALGNMYMRFVEGRKRKVCLENAMEWEKDTAARYAPHLLPQIDAAMVCSMSAAPKPRMQYGWTPLVHRSFDVIVQKTICVFLLGLERLMEGRGLDDDTRVAPQDPAMLEDSLRRGTWCQRCDFM
jgi:hypothetical protein